MTPDDVDAVLPQTFLAALPPALASEVLHAGKRLLVPAGRLLQHDAKRPSVAIVVGGLVRVFLESPRQRQVTVRYARPGETLGLVHLFGGRPTIKAQAVTSTVLYVVRAKRLRGLAALSAPLAVAIAGECAARVEDAVEELALVTFGTVRQRVARHLLDLAACEPGDHDLVANVTQQDLADATGSVREVVARVLKELHGLGLTRHGARGVVIVDATALDDEARGHLADHKVQ